MLPESFKPSPELMLTNQQWGLVAFTQEHFHKCLSHYYFVYWVWTLYFKNYCHISLGPMSLSFVVGDCVWERPRQGGARPVGCWRGSLCVRTRSEPTGCQLPAGSGGVRPRMRPQHRCRRQQSWGQHHSHEPSECREQRDSGKINIYVHFISFLHIDMTQVLEILPEVWKGPTYPT